MRIYQLTEDNGQEYEDWRVSDVIITENPEVVALKVMDKLENEDFHSNGYMSHYTYHIWLWENGKCKELFVAECSNKVETMNFLDTL